MLDSQYLERTIKQLQSSGILFCIEYVGSVIVKKSVNSLSSEQQKEFARACMQFVIKKSINSLNTGEDDETESIKYLKLPIQSFKKDVELNISSSAFIIIDTLTMRPLHRFNIQDVSLFSPGFDEFSTFFCFFAKENQNNDNFTPLRRCFVFNAQEELEDVRDAIYFAFKLNEHFVNNNKEDNELITQKRISSDQIEFFGEENGREEDVKTPIPCPTPPTPILSDEQNFFNNNKNSSNGNNNKCQNNLTPPELPPRKSRLSLSNDVSSSNTLAVHKRGRSESNFNSSTTSSFRLSLERLQELTFDLSNKKWFHGVLKREESDALLCKNGQFLVRNSPSNPNRFVLVGMHNGKVVNICLLNNEGKLKTTAGEFKNIVNFINYFHHSRSPVIVDEKSSPILLLYPINCS